MRNRLSSPLSGDSKMAWTGNYWVVVDNGDVFEGTISQFRDCHFSNANTHNIEAWAKELGYKVQFFPSQESYKEYCNAHLQEILLEGKISKGEEPIIETNSQLEAALKQITFINTVLDFKWKFHYSDVEVKYPIPGPGRQAWLVWVSFERPDTDTGTMGRGRGRDEIIWKGTTLSGVIKTCWLLVELMVRHELMEGYRWYDARIFNPHNSVLDLAKVQDLHAQRTKGK